MVLELFFNHRKRCPSVVIVGLTMGVQLINEINGMPFSACFFSRLPPARSVFAYNIEELERRHSGKPNVVFMTPGSVVINNLRRLGWNISQKEHHPALP
ncbi:hypothetical protein AVEN_219496-1 [Araneus ventricosus]|uniref:Uncharacterized protein n=1 Tax=Araneus ventricosus TaxID=182803 RepID=A0A4Y2BNV7_ARAVE|nr:hypothetical protein AVEN_219496-1 [Araneus ventricosus]